MLYGFSVAGGFWDCFLLCLFFMGQIVRSPLSSRPPLGQGTGDRHSPTGDGNVKVLEHYGVSL